MSDRAKLAAALCAGELPNREIAGVLFTEATFKEPMTMPTPPDMQSVKLAGKSGWVKAAIARYSKVPELLGEDGAKHTSVRVKQAYIMGGEDQAILERMEDIALKGIDTAGAWAGKVEPMKLLKRLSKGEPFPYSVPRALGGNLARRGMELEKSIKKIKPAHIRDDVFVGILEELLKQKDLVRIKTFLNTLPGSKLIETIVEAVEHSERELERGTLEFFENILERDDMVDLAGMLNPRHGVSMGFVEKVLSDYQEVAANYLEEVDVNKLSQEELNRHVVRLAEIGTSAMVGFVLDVATRRHGVSNEIIHAAVRKNIERGEQNDRRGNPWPEEFLRDWEHSLDTDVLLHIFRNSLSSDIFVAWVADELHHKPRPGEVQQLCSKPGLAFTSQWGSEDQEANLLLMTRQIAHRAVDMFEKPWADEVVETFGADLTKELILISEGPTDGYVLGSKVSNYLTKRFTTALGDDLEAWRTALAIVPTSTQPLGRTLSAVRRVVRASES
jgi:hypothetical protein